MIVRDSFQIKTGNFILNATDGFPVWKRVSQSAHGFSAGQVVYYTGTAYALAIADAAGTSEVAGVVWMTNTDEFILVQSGVIDGLSGLVAGTVYYLSASTAGAVTDTKPSAGNVVKSVLRAVSTTTAEVLDYPGIVEIQTNFQNTSLDSGNTDILDTIVKTSTFGCAWHVAVRASDKSAMRTSIVHACWRDDALSNNVVYEEVGTNNLGGSTADIIVTVDINGSNVRLLASNAGSQNGWIVKAKRIEI